MRDGEFELISPESCGACAAQHICLGDKKKRLKLQGDYADGEKVFLSVNTSKTLKSSAFIFAGALISGGLSSVLASFYLPEAAVALIFIITAFLWLLICARTAVKTDIQITRQP